MNSKSLLVHGITLLFRESQLLNKHENSAHMVREVVQKITLPEVDIGINHERDILDALKKVALEMCELPLDHEYEVMEMLQKLRVIIVDDDELYEAFKTGITMELTDEVLNRTCLNMRRTILTHFREDKVNEIISKAYSQIKFNRSKITDMRRFVQEVASSLEPYQVDIVKKDPAIITDVDTSNLEAVAETFTNIQEDQSGESVMRTGYQGINRMWDGGIRRGEEVCLGALQHNFKTGFSLAIFRQVAQYNKPFMMDPKKKPLLLRISFEDTAELNFQALYQGIWENEHNGEQADLTGKDPMEIAAYVHEKLHVNGYHVRIMHVNPSLWTYLEICNKVIELEADGFEIHLCMVDYLLKIPTTGCDQGPMGHDIRNMYERIKNFMQQRKIAFFTPHQLSPDAKRMFRDDRPDFVKQLVSKGMYSGCTQLDQVVDLETFIHIETVNNEAFLTIQRGKHRKIRQTAIEHLYCVLPFLKNGGILDDLFRPDSTRKRVGGGPVGSGQEIPFWDMV